MGISNPSGGFPFTAQLVGSDGIFGDYSVNATVLWDIEGYSEGMPAYVIGSGEIVFPDGTEYGQLSLALFLGGASIVDGAAVQAYIFKNGNNNYEGAFGELVIANGTTLVISGQTGIIPINDGDIFTVNLQVDAGADVLIAPRVSWFQAQALD